MNVYEPNIIYKLRVDICNVCGGTKSITEDIFMAEKMLWDLMHALTRINND